MRSSESDAGELAVLQLQRTPGRTAVLVTGEIDLSNAGAVHQQLLELAAADPGEPFAVDLGRLRFIDSAGISALIRLSDDLAREQRELTVVVREGGTAARTLRLAAMDDVLHLQFEPDDDGG